MGQEEMQRSRKVGSGGLSRRVRLKKAEKYYVYANMSTQPLTDKVGTPVEKIKILPNEDKKRANEESTATSEEAFTHKVVQSVVFAKPQTNKHVQHILRRRWKKAGQVTQKKRRLAMLTMVITCNLLVLLVLGGLGTAFNYYFSQLPLLDALFKQPTDQATRIYDRNGQLLFALYDNKVGRRIPVSYAQIPGVLQDAQIAAEDKTFWTNTGVDFQATLRSAIIDLAAHHVETGASTITQQVIKNLSKNRGLTGERKMSEAALAIGLTQTYPKSKILEMYFNIAAYGAQDVGIEAAAEDYFGLKPRCDTPTNCIPAIAFLDRDLTKCTRADNQASCQSNGILALARASLLSGLPQNPVSFDPSLMQANRDRLLVRQDYVLNQMMGLNMSINLGLGDKDHSVGIITPTVVKQVEALSKQINFLNVRNSMQAPHFVWWVISQLANALGSDQDINPDTGMSVSGTQLLITGGFNIRTTLDLRLEQYIEHATPQQLNQPVLQKISGQTLTLSKDNNINDAATVVMDAHNAEILAMDGSADWTSNDPRIGGELNAALTPRQAASTFKPIIMASAFQMGWYPGIVLKDSKTYFPVNSSSALYNAYVPTDDGTSYSYQNSNLDFAVSNSLNIPAVDAYMYAGQQNVYTMAQRLGITTLQLQQVNPTIALGTVSVSLLQMVGVYQVFANQGVRVLPRTILDIWDNYKHYYYHYDPTQSDGSRVLSAQTSYMVTSLLKDESARSYAFGNDHDLSMWDWTLPDGTHPDVAAKTGTSENYVDNWTLGYTPDLVVGVWAGNANGAKGINSLGLVGAAPLWHHVIEYASGYCAQGACLSTKAFSSNLHFSVPHGLIQQEVNTVNGLAGYGYVSWMLDGEQPAQSGLLK